MFLKLFLVLIVSTNVAFADVNIKTLVQNDPKVKRVVGSITSYVPLTGGLSGEEVYLLDNKFVLKRFKVYNPATISIQQKAAKQGIAPKILYANSKQRFVIMEFVVGSSLPRDHQTIEKLVQFVKTLHQIKPTKNMPDKDPFNYLASIVASLKRDNFSEELLNKFTAVLNLERNHNSDMVVSHNDLNPNNILFIKGKVNTVDWDSAGLADPYYDLGTLALWYMNIPEVQSKLLEGY
ncbi:MAG: phosphotransferase [Rickettsiaceae bacterium]|nr:phosphotransferase [Rickettsiaceae bacterium]